VIPQVHAAANLTQIISDLQLSYALHNYPQMTEDLSKSTAALEDSVLAVQHELTHLVEQSKPP
jgi:hypothetical protein